MKKDFYDKVADILGVEHEYNTFNDKIIKPFDRFGNPRTTNKNRWNGREPGNGRFQGFGIIRNYGTVIHVTLNHPQSVNKIFDKEDDVLEFLMDLIKIS